MGHLEGFFWTVVMVLGFAVLDWLASILTVF